MDRDEKYWLEIEKLSTERIEELTKAVSSTLKDGVHKRWLRDMITTNAQWKLLAEHNLSIIAKHKAHLAKVKMEMSIKLSTFRGNDDE